MALAHFHQVQADLHEPYRALTEAIPDVMAGYGALHDAAFVEGALNIKTKELIALSIAITASVTAASRPTAGTWRASALQRRRSPK